jgi:hypothetical protein
MRKSKKWIGFFCVALVLAGCSTPTAVPTSRSPIVSLAAATVTMVPTIVFPAPTLAPTSAPAAAETAPVVAPTSTQEPGGTQDVSQDLYLDDRSTPTGVIYSLVNALNRREYLRAYSYWQSPGNTPGLPPFAQFEAGYQDTASVQVMLGVVGGDAGAGQLYYTVPAVLLAKTTGGQSQIFAVCYTLHLSRPEIQAVPPFQPLGITRAAAKQAPNSPNTDDLLSHACDGPDVPQTTAINPQPVTDTTDIAASNYLDDRSDPVLVLRSLFNAINRKEYARAYSYWEDAGTSQNVPPFAEFQQGYQETASVETLFGPFNTGAAAGNLYYDVPAALKVKTTGGETQTFAGCYRLHLPQPANQATPPFMPMGIMTGSLKQFDNNADTTALLGAACQNAP